MSGLQEETDRTLEYRRRFLCSGPWQFTLPDGSELLVRAATLEDAAAVWEITNDAYQEHRGVLNPPNGSDFETPEAIHEQLQRGAALISLVDGAPAASLRASFEPSFLYIGRVGVKTAFRRLKIGHLMMQCAHTAAANCGYLEVHLGTRAQLEGNIQFYLSLGYTITGRQKHPRGTDDVVMFTLALCNSEAHL